MTAPDITTATAGVTMTAPSTPEIKTVPHPVSDHPDGNVLGAARDR
jgi:hypothetical protein